MAFEVTSDLRLELSYLNYISYHASLACKSFLEMIQTTMTGQLSSIDERCTLVKSSAFAAWARSTNLRPALRKLTPDNMVLTKTVTIAFVAHFGGICPCVVGNHEITNALGLGTCQMATMPLSASSASARGQHPTTQPRKRIILRAVISL